MAERSVYLNPSLQIKEALAELPSGFTSVLKKGFLVLGELSSKDRATDVVDIVLNEDSPGGRISNKSVKDISARLQVTEENVVEIFTTVKFCLTIFIQQKTLSADEFLEATAELGILDENEQAKLLPLIDFIADTRGSSSEITARNELTATLLPSLVGFGTTIDIRPKFADDGKTIKFSVPVVLAHIETDSAEKEIWLQMSKKQLQRLIENLQTVLEKVEVAEIWSNSKTID